MPQSFEQSIVEFCRGINFVGLHRLTTMFPNFIGSTGHNWYDTANQGWKELSPVSSVWPSYHLSSANTTFLHPGGVFFSKKERKDTPLVLDTGASTSVSPYKDDFVQFEERQSTVIGIGARVAVEGVGVVR